MTRQVFCKRIDSNVFTFPDAEGSIVFQFLTFADAEESMDFQFLAFTELMYFNAMPKAALYFNLLRLQMPKEASMQKHVDIQTASTKNHKF